MTVGLSIEANESTIQPGNSSRRTTWMSITTFTCFTTGKGRKECPNPNLPKGEVSHITFQQGGVLGSIIASGKGGGVAS